MGALLDALPQGGSAADVRAREALLLQYVQDGSVTWDWIQVQAVNAQHKLTFYVQRDGMKLEGVRLDMSATLAQQIADEAGAVLPTPRINDLVWQQAAVKVAPITRPITASVAAMIAQSAAIDAKVGEAYGLVADIGKDWVLVNGLLTPTNGCGPGWPALAVGQVAANYGWHVNSGEAAVTPGLHVIQSVGRCHDRAHSDYSQNQRLVMLQCDLDGQSMDIRDVMTSPDPAVNSLVSHEGQLKTVRQPGVTGSGSGGGAVPGPGPGPARSTSVGTGAGLGTFVVATLLTLVGGLAWRTI